MRFPILVIFFTLVFPTTLWSDAVSDGASTDVDEQIRALKQTASLAAIAAKHQDGAPDEETTSTYQPATPDTKSLRLQERLQAIDMQINRDADEDGFSISNGDCDDQDPLTYPGAYELQDKIDNNCDGVIDNNTAGLH